MSRMRWLTAVLAGCWVLAVVAGLLVGVSLPAAGEQQCPSREFVPQENIASLWNLRIEPGSRYDDVLDRVKALEDESMVTSVTYVPEPGSAPAGADRWVYDFGFIPQSRDAETETREPTQGETAEPTPGETDTYPYSGPPVTTADLKYVAVVCLGGRVPDVVGETVDEAVRRVQASGLTPEVADGDSSSRVTELVPSPGKVVEFGTQVRITAQPTVRSDRRDLAVQQPQVEVVDAERLRVGVAVENVGEVPVDGARLVLEFAGSTAECVLAELQPGAQRSCERSLEVPPDARGSTSVLVARLDLVDDDTSNNQRRVQVDIPGAEGPAPVLPDLVVEGLVARAVDGDAQVEGAVVNRGDAAAARTTVLLRAGDATPVSLPVPPLAAGGRAPFNRTIALPDGLTEVTVQVTADPHGLVTESNDQNNVDSRELVLLSGRTDNRGGSTGTQQTREDAAHRWWLAAPAALLVIAASALGVRAAHHRRGRDWVHRHVQVRADRDPGRHSVQQAPDHSRSHTVRIEPEPGQVQTRVEEVEQP